MPQAEGHCATCQHSSGVAVSKIAFRFNLDRAPPGVPPECVLCPCCDPLWREIGQPPLQLPEAPVARRGLDPARPQLGPADTRSNGNATSASAPGPGPAMSDYQAALAGKRRATHTATATASVSAIATPGGRGAPGRGGAAGGGAGFDNREASAVGGAIIHPDCVCAVPSKLLTVSKEGPNKGRKFFACAKPRYDFILYAGFPFLTHQASPKPLQIS